jgi:hypothetical protein
MNADAQFILELAKYGVLALAVLVAGFTIMGVAIVRRATPETISSNLFLFDQTGILRIVAVVVIVLAVLLLALLGKIEGPATVSTLSGIAGFVLGSSTRLKRGGSAPPVDG